MRFWWVGGRRRLRFWIYLVCACVAWRLWGIGVFTVIGG